MKTLKVDADKIQNFIRALNNFKSDYQTSINKEKELSTAIANYNAHGKGNISISGLENAMDYPNKVIDDFADFLKNTVSDVSGVEDEILKMANMLTGASMVDGDGYIRDNQALLNLLETEGGATDEYTAKEGGNIKQWVDSAFADGKFKLTQDEVTGSYRIDKYDEDGNLIGYTGFINQQVAENFMNQASSGGNVTKSMVSGTKAAKDLTIDINRKINNLEDFTIDGDHIFYLNDNKGSRIYNENGITFSWDDSTKQYIANDGTTLSLEQLKNGTFVSGKIKAFDGAKSEEVQTFVSGINNENSLAQEINQKIGNLEDFTIDGNHILSLDDDHRAIYDKNGVTFSWNDRAEQYEGTDGTILTLEQLKNGKVSRFSKGNSSQESSSSQDYQNNVLKSISNREDFTIDENHTLKLMNKNKETFSNVTFTWNEEERCYVGDDLTKTQLTVSQLLSSIVTVNSKLTETKETELNLQESKEVFDYLTKKNTNTPIDSSAYSDKVQTMVKETENMTPKEIENYLKENNFQMKNGLTFEEDYNVTIPEGKTFQLPNASSPTTATNEDWHFYYDEGKDEYYMIPKGSTDKQYTGITKEMMENAYYIET